MGKAYTKEDVINAALMRFETLGVDYISRLRPMYAEFYDEKGKDTFRTYASVTPEVMRIFFEKEKNNETKL